MIRYDTKSIDPTWGKIYISTHAIEQYQSRVMDKETYSNKKNIIKRLKNVLLKGRRSDREPFLKTELEPWLNLVKWNNKERPVSVWMDDKRLCCLVVRDLKKEDCLVVLTCFCAVERIKV